MSLIYFFFSLITASLLLPPVFAFLNKSFLLRNYQGKLIPSGTGILFIFNCLTLYPLMVLLTNINQPLILLKGYTLGMIAFVGGVDDFLGDSSRGFRGHVKILLREKRFTSGGLKAAAGLLTGFMLGAFRGGGIMEIGVDALVFALSVNTLNLMDVRPGRSIKLYLFLSIFIIIIGRDAAALLIAPVLGAALRLLPLDLKEEGMLGDMGSNLLGASAGFFLVMLLNLHSKIIVLGVLLLTQWVGDHISFSKLIESNNMLRYIDLLGRK